MHRYRQSPAGADPKAPMLICHDRERVGHSVRQRSFNRVSAASEDGGLPARVHVVSAIVLQDPANALLGRGRTVMRGV